MNIDSILKVVRGIVRLRGGTDNTIIGNVGDKLKVDAEFGAPDGGLEIKFVDGSHSVDALNRLRVSNPINIFQYSNVYDIDFDNYWDETTATGATVVYNSDKSARILNVTTSTGSKAVIQTRRRMEYSPGKSHIFYFTGNFKGSQAGVRKRYGFYDDSNGPFFELDGTTLRVVIRSSTSGSVVDTKIDQANWNIDVMDGTGPSGFDLSTGLDDINLFWIDFAWLGAGFIRYGIVYQAKFWPVHVQYIASEESLAWAKSMVLPFRAEIESTGSPSSADSLEIVCMGYDIEGKKAPISRIRSYDDETTQEDYDKDEEKVLTGIRINSSFLNSSIKLKGFSVLPFDLGKFLLWKAYFNPNLSGGQTWTNQPDSIAQVLTSYPTVSGGFKFASGYLNIEKQENEFPEINLDTDLFLGFDLSDTPDTIIITVEPFEADTSLLATLQWEEFI